MPRTIANILDVLASAIVPATTPTDDASPDDYRRAVLLIALVAMAFFVPSLAIAEVPPSAWLWFTGLATAAAVLIAGSFILVRRGSPVIFGSVVASSVMLGLLGATFRPYYHEIGLLYALVVAALAIVHGFAPAALMAALGGWIVPVVIQGQATTPTNATDPVYASIYLAGAALIPWVAGRLAKGRLIEVRRHLASVTEAEREAVQMLARAAEAKDDVTGGHVLRVGDVAATLARAAGRSGAEADEIRLAAMLHDVGKLHVPDRILMKPGPLDPEEWEIVRRHTIWGERILGGSSAFEVARQVARGHHENWDGSGYPDRLAGPAAPLAARIVHLADVFDALRLERPYKPAWPLEQVLAELRAQSGRMFDPELVAELIRLAEAGVVAGGGSDSGRGPSERSLDGRMLDAVGARGTGAPAQAGAAAASALVSRLGASLARSQYTTNETTSPTTQL